MNKLQQYASLRQLLFACLAVTFIGGCGAGGWVKARLGPEPDAADDILGAPDAETYVSELGIMAGPDAAAKAEVYADADAAARLTPGTLSNLRFGLILAVPGHPRSDPNRAARLLRDALDQAELLSQAELALARVMLASAERQSFANEETRRLRDASSQAVIDEQQAAEQRLAAAEAENRRLRAALAEAEQKIEALTSIEQSIRERE